MFAGRSRLLADCMTTLQRRMFAPQGFLATLATLARVCVTCRWNPTFWRTWLQICYCPSKQPPRSRQLPRSAQMSRLDHSRQGDFLPPPRPERPNHYRFPPLGIWLITGVMLAICYCLTGELPPGLPNPTAETTAGDPKEIKPGAELNHPPGAIVKPSSAAPNDLETDEREAQTSRPIRGRPPVIAGESTPPTPHAGSGGPVRGNDPQTKPRPPPDLTERARAPLIQHVTLKNQDGRVIYQGPIDLQPTLDRIEKGERNQHRNDGSVFQNREGKLARKPSGYYHEYVVPTPDQHGPGPQRLILGKGGEVYYTSDHYRSFKKIAVQIAVP